MSPKEQQPPPAPAPASPQALNKNGKPKRPLTEKQREILKRNAIKPGEVRNAGGRPKDPRIAAMATIYEMLEEINPKSKQKFKVDFMQQILADKEIFRLFVERLFPVPPPDTVNNNLHIIGAQGGGAPGLPASLEDMLLNRAARVSAAPAPAVTHVIDAPAAAVVPGRNGNGHPEEPDEPVGKDA